jgi:FixJ family two-component response regulator
VNMAQMCQVLRRGPHAHARVPSMRLLGIAACLVLDVNLGGMSGLELPEA